MRCNGDNNDLIVGAVVEENPIRGGRPAFSIGLEDWFAAWSLKCLKLAGSQTRMSRIRLEQAQRLLNGPESFPQSAILRKCFQNLL